MTRRTAALYLAALLACSAPAACSGDDDASPGPTGSTSTTLAPAPEPELLDPGAEPRRALRIRFREGLRARAAITSDLGIRQARPGAAVDPPPVRTVVEHRIGRVDDGEATLSIRVAEAGAAGSGTELAEAELAAVDLGLQAMVGLAATARISDRATVRGVRYDLPPDLPDELRAQLTGSEAMLVGGSVPLPREPVGVGGRWTAVARTEVNGIATLATTTYEITAIEGDLVSYTGTVEITDDGGGPVDPDVLPDGVELELVSAEGSGTVAGTLDLASPVSESRSRAEVHQVLRRTDAGAAGARTVEQDVTVALAIRPQP